MAPPHTLRLAGPDDREALLPLLAEFYAHEGMPPFQADKARAPLARLLAEPALGLVWLVESGGAPAGYAMLTFNFDLEYGGLDAFITDLYLRPALRGAGVGRELLRRIEARAAKLEVGGLYLSVRTENAPARALYARAGFVPQPDRVLLHKLLR